MVGMVRTVLGDVEPGTLGVTLTHEHLLISFDRWRREAGAPSVMRAPSADPRARQPIALENAGWVRRHWNEHADNSLLDDVDLAIRELRRFKDAGGGTVVDATNPD